MTCPPRRASGHALEVTKPCYARTMLRASNRPTEGPSPGSFADQLVAEHARLRRKLPDFDSDELYNILHSLMRPFGSGRRFLLRRREDGSYVF